MCANKCFWDSKKLNNPTKYPQLQVNIGRVIAHEIKTEVTYRFLGRDIMPPEMLCISFNVQNDWLHAVLVLVTSQKYYNK